MRPDDPLDQTLLGFSEDDPFSIRDAFEGVQIFGGIGSGKTSGSGALFARSFLAAGFGGLVLTAKVDETDLWRRYAQETGREEDLVIIGPDATNRFNFLDYEGHHPDAEVGLTENIVRLLETVSGSVQGKGKATHSDDQFWDNEYRKLLRNSIDMLRFAGKPITLENIHKMIMSAPLSADKFNDEAWREDSFNHQALMAANERDNSGELSPEESHDFAQTFDFWLKDFPFQHEKTRATVISMFTGVSDVFLRGILYRIFGTNTTITPEASLDGKIIVLDLPEKRFHELGVAAQVLFKFCWQRAIERRNVESDSRPVFLWMDESQLFVNKHDVSFQTTSRSARVATVLLTQNLPNYYAAFGGETAAKSFVDSLIGNLNTKIFHNNTCAVTNQYAAELFARDWQRVASGGTTSADGKMSFNQGTSDHLEYTVLPREFTNLATGGPKNDFIVEGIVHHGGRIFNCSGGNALKCVFAQTQTQ
jgi:hypothetical protein